MPAQVQDGGWFTDDETDPYERLHVTPIADSPAPAAPSRGRHRAAERRRSPLESLLWAVPAAFVLYGIVVALLVLAVRAL